MGFYVPCYNCVLEKLPCARRERVAAGIKGLGLTSAKFRCPQREPVFRVGQRVSVGWLVPPCHPDECSYEDYMEERWPATVVAERGSKFQIIVDDVSSDEGTPARDYIKSESLHCKVTVTKLAALDEPPRAVCGACQAMEVNGTTNSCNGYDDGPGYRYVPRGCLRAALASADTPPRKRARSMTTPAKIAAARKLVADTEARLVAAERVFAGNRLSVCDLNLVRDMLRRVRVWKNDSDETVTLAFGFIGANGYGALIDRLCALADAERQKLAA